MPTRHKSSSGYNGSVLITDKEVSMFRRLRGRNSVTGRIATHVATEALENRTYLAGSPPEMLRLNVDPPTESLAPSFFAEFRDRNRGETQAASVEWGDGSTENLPVERINRRRTVLASHQYAGPGVFAAVLRVTDSRGLTLTQNFS